LRCSPFRQHLRTQNWHLNATQPEWQEVADGVLKGVYSFSKRSMKDANPLKYRVYEFGPFRLQAVERRLQRNGTSIALTPKAFEVLSALVTNPGRLLTKEELLNQVWPNTFVQESTLVQNIATLRRALSEHSGGQQFIETVPKAGYRFVAEVSIVDERRDEPVQLQERS